MGRMKLLILCIFFALVIAGIAKDKILDTPQHCIKKIKLLPDKNTIEANIFNLNKTLTYKMYLWSLIPVGEFKFTTEAQGLDVVFSFKASTQGTFIEYFVTADARVESYFSKKSLMPHKYAERTEVKGKIKKKEVLYDRANLLSLQGNKKIKISNDTYDPVGAFVHMLTLPLEKGKEYHIPFMSGHDMYIFKASVLNETQGISEVSIDMRRKNLTSSHGGHLHVWITANNRRIPLLFKSWTPIGYASVVLDRVSMNEGDK